MGSASAGCREVDPVLVPRREQINCDREEISHLAGTEAPGARLFGSACVAEERFGPYLLRGQAILFRRVDGKENRRRPLQREARTQ
jgi:hypothetical protein